MEDLIENGPLSSHLVVRPLDVSWIMPINKTFLNIYNTEHINSWGLFSNLTHFVRT